MANPYRIYMDVCCLNRPFDDQTQPRIRLEAEAIAVILEHCQTDDWLLVASTALQSEIAQTPEAIRRQRVMDLIEIAKINLKVTVETIKRAGDLQELGFQPFDALHIACAEAANVDAFLTTDDRLLRRASTYIDQLNVQVQNPLTWLMETTTDPEGENK